MLGYLLGVHTDQMLETIGLIHVEEGSEVLGCPKLSRIVVDRW